MKFAFSENFLIAVIVVGGGVGVDVGDSYFMLSCCCCCFLCIFVSLFDSLIVCSRLCSHNGTSNANRVSIILLLLVVVVFFFVLKSDCKLSVKCKEE